VHDVELFEHEIAVSYLSLASFEDNSSVLAYSYNDSFRFSELCEIYVKVEAKTAALKNMTK
jgi:hypothetical protein